VPAERPARPALLRAVTLPRVLAALWLAATAELLVLTALAAHERTTWYLAVDQFGYLTFAHDLLHGRVFHHWPPLDALAARLPARVDVLVQTYVADHGRLYCRYPPGYPLLLAGWIGLLGDDAAHVLNPTIFLALLALLIAFQARLFHSRWWATAGVALVVLLSGRTELFLWALTIVRDPATHLAALLGLFLLLPAGGARLSAHRVAAAGLALGYAGSIRPDAVLYLLPAGLIAAARWRDERPGWRPALRQLAAGAVALTLGLAPLLAYNTAATGRPWRLTQGMEVQGFLAAPPGDARAPRMGFPPGAWGAGTLETVQWRGGTVETVQGGGLRLANLPRVLPENLAHLRAAYGDALLALAVFGALVALGGRRILLLAALPYALLALIFFSCWSKPDPRYLSGVHLLLPLLVVEGALGTPALVRRLARAGRPAEAWGLAAGFALLLGAATLGVGEGAGTLARRLFLVPALAAAGALAAATWSRREVTAGVAPALALALVGLAGWRLSHMLELSAVFQEPEMAHARAVFARKVEPGAVVITTEDVGRPAENIEYYSGVAHALYLTDLERWGLTVGDAAELLARGGMRPYLLLPKAHPGLDPLLAALGRRFAVELAADIPARRAVDYFVAAQFLPEGIHMQLHRLGPLGAGAP